MTHALEMRKVFYRHPNGKADALHDVSFDCKRGSATLIVGSVGSGKSTLIHLLAALIRPDAGEILAAGAAVSRFIAPHRDHWRRQVGIVFQHLALLENRSVSENVRLPLYPLRQPRADREQAVGRALERVGLRAFSGTAVSALSGGERQRCAVARALVSTPRYLLADEPTAHLDAPGVQLVMDCLVDAKNSGVTAVVVSHDPRLEMHPLFDHCLRLESGRLKTDG